MNSWLKNRCAKMAWKVIAFIAGGIVVAYILLIIFAKIFAFSPKQPSSREETQVIAEAVGIE